MPACSLRQKAFLPEDPPPIVSIGLGGIVHDAHYPAYRIAGFAVVGGCDINAERAAMMKDKFDIPLIYESHGEAIDTAPRNAVFDVAVPGSAITAILREIPAGRAVLIQKPMGEDMAQAREILDLCRQRKLVAAINFQLRFAPFVIAARHDKAGTDRRTIRRRVPSTVQYALASLGILVSPSPRRNPLSQYPLCGSGTVVLWHAEVGLCQDHEPPIGAGTERRRPLNDYHGLR